VWLSVLQFVPYFVWVGAWLWLITRRPSYYKHNRQPLVLLMRCGALISEARALHDGGKVHLGERILNTRVLALGAQQVSAA
jgi:hypothetical protein